MKAPIMPPCDHQPKPYSGPSFEEVMDLRKRYGEALYEPAKPTEIWVQPPGTPFVGEAFLRAWRITGDPRYMDAARDAARALLMGGTAVLAVGRRRRLRFRHLRQPAADREEGWYR